MYKYNGNDSCKTTSRRRGKWSVIDKCCTNRVYAYIYIRSRPRTLYAVYGNDRDYRRGGLYFWRRTRESPRPLRLMCNSGLITGVRIIIIIIIIIVRTGRCVCVHCNIPIYTVARVLYINLYYYTGWAGCSFCLGGSWPLHEAAKTAPAVYSLCAAYRSGRFTGGVGGGQRLHHDDCPSTFLPETHPPHPPYRQWSTRTHITSWGLQQTHTHTYIYI